MNKIRSFQLKKKKEHKIQIMIVLNRAQDEVILVHWLN